MTREECMEILQAEGKRPHTLKEGDLIYVTSEGNPWMNARFIWEMDGKLFFFTEQGKETLLTTPYIITKLPEEDEDEK